MMHNGISATAVRKALYVLVAAMVWLPAPVCRADSGDIVSRIQEESGGNVTIDMPASLLELMMQNISSTRAAHDSRASIGKLNGFRIQVFSDGRNQSTLEARAKARGNAILARLPKYRGQIYTYSSSPNWYTRVGNFRTQADANKALEELKSTFPAFAPEMRVVKSQIVVIRQ